MRPASVIVVAAGEGTRFGSAKQFAQLKGKTVLDWCLEMFEQHESIGEIVLVLPETVRKRDYIQKYSKLVSVAPGGKRRQDSVYAGLQCIEEKKPEIVLVHDGVRPLVSKSLISRIIEAAYEKGAVVPAIPVEDTLKVVEKQRILRTEERTHLFRSQTPQGFSCSLLTEALSLAKEQCFCGTDEASLVERMGRNVFVIEGDSRNLKITTPDDLKIAEAFLGD